MIEEFTGAIGIVFLRGEPNKFALIHNNKTGNITLPAGGREEGEDLSEDSLKREIKEETGLAFEDYKIISTGIVHEFVYNSKKVDRAGMTAKQPVYLVESKKEELNPEDSDSEFYGWYNFEEVLDKLTFDDSKEIFKRAVEFIK